MMTHAKRDGCNAVKFQAFNEQMVSGHSESSRLMKSAISNSNIETINELAKNVGIEWFCTPMYPEAVEMLIPFVTRFKIRLTDGKPILENKKSDILERILKSNKEVIISTQLSPRGNFYYRHPKIKWLYCVPKYPCNFSDLDFRNLKDFDGYSNHCPHFLAPLTAVILGAKIIEIHITSDKSKNFVDNNVSFDYNELSEFMQFIELYTQILS